MTPDSSVSYSNDLPDLLNRLRVSLSAVEAYWDDRSNRDRDVESELQATRTVLNRVNQTLDEAAGIPLVDRKNEMSWLASFPETNPNPILEFSLDGRIYYANPSLRQLFPDLEQQQTAHPFLAGWEGIVERFRNEPGLNMVRDVQVGSRYYQQAIYFVEEYQRLRVYGRDITERRKAEEALQEANETLQDQADELEIQTEELQNQNEELSAANQKLHENEKTLRDYLEGMHDMFLALDGDWRIVYANQGFTEVMGFHDQELTGRDFWQTFPNFVGTPVEENYRRVMQERSPAHFEPRGVYTQQWYDVFVYPTGDGIAVFISDRTEEFKAREALRESESRFRLALQNSEIVVATLDRDRRYTWAYNTRHGVTPEATVGKRAEELLPPEEVAETIAMQKRVLETGVGERQEVRRVTGGQQWFYDATMEPLKNEAGEVAGLAYVAIDVTARKRMENEIKEAERKYRELIQYAPVGIYEVDFRKQIFKSVNDVMCQLTGYSRDDLLGMNPLAILDEQSRLKFKERINKWLAGEKPEENVEYKVLAKDGHELYVVLDVTFTTDEKRNPLGATVVGHDITERKKREAEREQLLALLEEQRVVAESLASEAEQRAEELDTTFTALAEAVIVYDASGKIQRANPAAVEMLGFDPTRVDIAGLVGKLSSRYPDGQPVEPANTPSARALAGETVTDERYVLTNAKGRASTVITSSSPLWKDGKITGAVAVMHDVTEREQLLADVQRQAAELETIMATVPAIIWVSHDPECRQMTGNCYSYEFLGSGPGTNVSMSAPPEERTYRHKAYKNGHEVPPSEMPMQVSAATGKPSQDYEFEVHFEDGTIRHLIGNANPLLDAEGRANGAVSAFIDISERIRAEEQLAYQAEILARVHDAIVATDNQMRITYWNKTAEETFGWSEQEAIGKNTNDLFQTQIPESTRQEAMERLMTTGHYDGEVMYRCKSGAYIQAHSRSAALRDKQGEFIGLVTSVRDITERKRLEQQLQEANAFLEQRVHRRTQELQSANEELEMAEEELKVQNEELEKALVTEKSLRTQLIQAEKYAALTRLVGSVAHEINNPIQTVKNCLYLIRCEPIPEGAINVLDMAESELQRISNLVQQLRETYRPTKVQPVDFNLIEVLSKVSSLLAPQMRQNNVQWQVHYEQDNITLHGIPDQIQQVCLNICLNAIDAMGTNGGRLEVAVSLPPGQKKVQISFHDSGPGIPENIIDQIFEPFFTTKTKGTGLGLSICYEIVKDHGGEIIVESPPGMGATFVVTLPIL